MTGDRPRPQYGEYATPQEQAAAMGLSYPDAAAHRAAASDAATDAAARDRAGNDAAAAPAATPAASVTPAATATPNPGAQAPAAVRAAGATSARPARRWDSVLTVTLLGIGAWSVLGSMSQYLSFGSAVREALDQFGYPGFTSIDFANRIGFAFAVTQAILLLVVVTLAIRTARRGRLAFPVALVGGAIHVVLSIAVAYSVLVADPGFADYLASRS